jgi:hypothetical protein
MSNGDRKGFYELKPVGFVELLSRSHPHMFIPSSHMVQEFRVRVRRREVATMEED